MTDAGRMLADPHWFPHHLDFATGRLTLVPTTRDRLAEQPFMDGRTDFSTAEARRLDLAAALAGRPEPDDEPDRMIFHVGFCGSTLLATVLDRPGQLFALREPNILAELANGRGSGREIAEPLSLARDLLRRRWSAGELVACKPSNWVNRLLPELTADTRSIRPLFLAMGPRAFLLAAFRGGRDRLAFLIGLAAHLAPAVSGGEALWQAGSEATADPLDRAARLVLVALQLQLALFAEAQASGGWGDEHTLSFEDLEADLTGAAVKASRALGLPLGDDELAGAAERHRRSHAKQRGLDWSAERRTSQDAEVERFHGARIDSALDWAALTFPAG